MLYGRRDCPLCEEMGAGLEALGVGFDFVDIDADPALRARYDWDVPVLGGAAGEVCRHRLDPGAVRAYLSR